MKQNQRHFTLIELLVTVGIILALLGLTLPAFQRMVSGDAVTVAGRMVSSQLRLARAAAMSEQRYIALVFPQKNADVPPEDDTTNPFRFKSFRVAVVTAPTTVGEPFTFKAWYPGSSWAFLPEGAVIAQIQKSVVKSGDEASFNRSFPVKRVAADREAYYVPNDKTDGTSWLDSDKLPSVAVADTSRVVESTTAAGAMIGTDDGYSNCTNAGAHYLQAIVFDPKGRCCTAVGTQDDRYVVIVEGNVESESAGSETNYVLENRNLLNMRVLKVHKYTGYCDYLDLRDE